MRQEYRPPMAVLTGKREETNSPRPPVAADAHTILGPHARFNGKLVFEGAVRIDGEFEGEIVTEDLLMIAKDARVKATLRVGSVVIHGFVEGDVHASNSVEIRAPGRLLGNIQTPSLLIEKGVTFDGSCKMTGGKNGAPPPPPKAEG